MDRIILSVLGILAQLYVQVNTDKGHKVHNLILYPNKHEWCEAKQIEMVITHSGCTSRTLSNRVCVGQCFSYTSPRTRPPNRVEDKLRYCDFCAPSNTTWETIVLECDTERYSSVEKEVEVIHECGCEACHPDQNVITESLDDNYLYEYDDDDPYEDYEGEEQDARMAQIVQEKLQSEDVSNLEQGDQRYVEFNISPDTLDRASRVMSEQQHQHHHRDAPSPNRRDEPSHHRDAASPAHRDAESHHNRDAPSPNHRDAESHIHRDASLHHQRDASSHHRRYNSHDPHSRQWILNSEIELEN